MTDSRLKVLKQFGQSPWLDFIERDLIRSGELASMMERWGICGVTSNPTIFERAIAHGDDYKEAISELVRIGRNASEIYEALIFEDIRTAADVMRSVYDESDGLDGFVSLEVSPHLVNDSTGTIREARRLWIALDRPNAMIKVPATRAGLIAIRQLISEGVNINVTLLFSLERYRQVTDAYIGGLEDALVSGRPLASIASVASFFLSRIDSMIDPRLKSIVAEGGVHAEQAKALRGEVAIASAKRAYVIFENVFKSKRFQLLAAQDALPQRLLWASTGTKNPEDSDLKYVEPLIGPNTVNTMPLATLKAYDDHGEATLRLQEDLDGAARTLTSLGGLGIDLGEIGEQLLQDGIMKFVESFDGLHEALDASDAA